MHNDTHPERIINSAGIETTVHKKNPTASVNDASLRRIEKVVKPRAERAEISYDQVRDLIADGDEWATLDNKPSAVSLFTIAQRILGFDPSAGKDNAAYGGKTKEGWYGEHISMTALRKVIAQLEEDGVIKAVKASGAYERGGEERFVQFPYRTKSGYVLADDYEASVARYNDKAREVQIQRLRQEAYKTVAERHADELEAEVERLISERGI